MPTYQYACTSCGDELEVVQSMHDDALTDCPSCGDGRLRKLFGNVGVVFKGSGFYRTDSRSSAGSGSSKDAPKAGASSSGSSSGSASGDSSSSSSGSSSSGSSSSGSSGSSKPSGSSTSAA